MRRHQRGYGILHAAFLFAPGLILATVVLTGCDLSNSDDHDPQLDDDLIAEITLDGQRRLASFILPNSDDLAAIPQDPANPLTPEKVQLGKLLFHETALATSPGHEAGRGTYSCATCHHADAGFQAGRQQGIGDGGSGWGVRGERRTLNSTYGASGVDVQSLRTPSILNSAYQEVMMWSGSFGATGRNSGTEASWKPGTPQAINHLGYAGVESQAIAGLSTHRMDNIETSIVATDPTYQDLWQRAFPDEPVSVVGAGLAIAAYERTVVANRAPFQRWLRGELDAMTDAGKRGALLFFGKASCENVCHAGPALNAMEFYALGMPDMSGPDVVGTIPESLGRGGFLEEPEEEYKFKVPQVYNLSDSPFYGHGGTFTTIREVVEYYNDGIPAKGLPPGRLTERFKPLNLTESEIDDIVQFLTVSLYDPDLQRYAPQSVPSGNCFPANDAAARTDLGC